MQVWIRSCIGCVPSVVVTLPQQPTVQDIERAVQHTAGVNPKACRLQHHGRPLPSSGVVQLQAGDEVLLLGKLCGGAGEVIFLKTLTGHTITMEAHLDMDAMAVRLDVYFHAFLVPENTRHCIFSGKAVTSGKTLGEYGVVKEETLHVVTPFRGGAVPPDPLTPAAIQEALCSRGQSIPFAAWSAVSAGAPPPDLDPTSSTAARLLIYAVLSGHAGMVRALLEAGVSPHAADDLEQGTQPRSPAHLLMLLAALWKPSFSPTFTPHDHAAYADTACVMLGACDSPSDHTLETLIRGVTAGTVPAQAKRRLGGALMGAGLNPEEHPDLGTALHDAAWECRRHVVLCRANGRGVGGK